MKAIREGAQKVGDKDVLKAINALDLKGIFDADDMKKDPALQNDSETWAGLAFLETDTWLAADYFKDNDIGSDKVRAEVLIHEGWHAWNSKSDRIKTKPMSLALTVRQSLGLLQEKLGIK